MEITMRYVRGHVEVYTAAGQFLFSADTEAEAAATKAADLRARFGPDVTAEFRTSPGLIGGLRIRLGSDVLDGSVKARLDKLADAIGR